MVASLGLLLVISISFAIAFRFIYLVTECFCPDRDPRPMYHLLWVTTWYPSIFEHGRVQVQPYCTYRPRSTDSYGQPHLISQLGNFASPNSGNFHVLSLENIVRCHIQ